MKRLAKTPIFLVAISSLLTACSQKSIAGTYGFQLGKEKGTHFGIYLKLSDKKFVDEEHPEINPKAKKCEFSFSANFSGDSSEMSELLESIKELLNQEGKNRVSIPGYYYPAGKVTTNSATELKLGIDFNFIKETVEDPDFPDIDLPVLTPDKIELVVYTTYSNNTVTLNIPVSVPDIIYQLYWYGYDFSYSEDDGFQFIDSPYGEHKAGTHPTLEDVTAINETYNYEEAHKEFAQEFDLDLGAYRDYYTLAMGLVKN